MENDQYPQELSDAQNNWCAVGRSGPIKIMVAPEYSCPKKYLQVTLTLAALKGTKTISVKLTVFLGDGELYQSKFMRLKPFERRRVHIPVRGREQTPIEAVHVMTHKKGLLLVSIRAK